MPETRIIYCCGCERDVQARLTFGDEIYPSRPDLASLPFWRCDSCRNYVGCHHKTDKPTRPLGCIPTPELRRARGKIHAILDPLWKSGRIGRRPLYAKIAERMEQRSFHTSHIRTIEQAREVYRVVLQIGREL